MKYSVYNILTNGPTQNVWLVLGTPVCTIIDEFLEKFQKGGGHFRSKKFRCKIFSIRDANLGGSFPFQKFS